MKLKLLRTLLCWNKGGIYFLLFLPRDDKMRYYILRPVF